MASRGHLAGKKYPMRALPQSSSPAGSTSQCAVSQNGVYLNGLGHGPSALTRYGIWHQEDVIFLPHPAADRRLIEDYTSVTVSDDLLTYFDISVAPRLTWVDGPDHPWRSLVFPLAQRCPCLRLSILSVAAAHLSFTSPKNQPQSTEIQAMNHRLRDASLRALNDMIRVELDKNDSSNSYHEASSLIGILATTLVLCYGEMLVPNSRDWNLHLRACRALIERHQWRDWHSEPKDAATRFLINEVSDIEVFRTFGAFTREDPLASLPSRPIIDSHFGAFTGLLWEITVEERRRYGLSQNGQDLPPINMNIWRAKVEHAYTRASTDTAWLSITHGPDTQKWMDAIVRAVYHATLIYAYQALAPTSATKAISSPMKHLIQDIDFVTAGSVHILSHDIFLPLFIAGTECWTDATRQTSIEKLYLDLVSTTGLWCNSTAIHFLKAFWNRTEYHGVGKWIAFAREHERYNGPFLIF